MIKATDDELSLVFGLLVHPVMVPEFTDFTEQELNRIPFAIIKYLREVDQEKLIANCGLIPLFNLKRRKVITEEECSELIELYGTYPALQTYVIDCYSRLKEDYRKKLLSLNLSTIDIEDESTDIYTKLSDAMKIINVDNDEYVESVKDIEPRSNKMQESIVKFNHSKMQHDIAIDKNYLVVIGARPGGGKTTFAMKLAMENSKNGKILFYSLEMSKEQITRKAKHYGGYYQKGNVYIKQASSLTCSQISKDVRKFKPKFVIVDQLNKVVEQGKNELEKLTNAIRNLKILAVNINTPMIVLHQINRSAEESKRPYIHHLKGSGAVEEESDIILLLSVSGEFTTVHCDKNRSLDGSVGEYNFKFDKKTNLYQEV